MTATTPATAPIKILYNDCYGGFAFSAEFEAAYKERTGRDVNTFKRLFRAGPSSVRSDPVAVELFERLGSERASGANASLAVREIPPLFERYWSIEDADGDETVHVDVNEAYADLLHQFMETGDSGALCDGYRAVRVAAARLVESSGIGLGIGMETAAAGAGTTPPLLKRPSIVSEEEATTSADDYARTIGYSYFGVGDDGDGDHAGAGHA